MLGYCGSFVDELEKISWFGTYYHGTSPEAEKSILQEGLKASHGGKGGATEALGKAFPGNPFLERFQKETAGKVTMSRSKLLAKTYGLSGHRNRIAKELALAYKSGGEKAVVKGLLKELVGHQPLEIAGKSLKGLTRDPSHFFLGVQSAKDIPASLVSKATPSRLGKLLTKVLVRK